MGEKCQDIELQAYLDDELSRNKRARVEAHLAQCDHCKQQLEILELQGSVLREEIEEAAEQADFEGFEDRVLAGIRASRPPSAVQRAGFWLREVLAQYRTVWITSLVTAAVLLLVLIPLMGGSQTGQDQPEGSGPAVADEGDSRVARVDNEVIIDSLEYAGQRSMIFTVSKNNTTVIWLYDFDGAGEDSTGGNDL